MIIAPTISAIGRFLFAFFNSPFMEVATIQPSYANANAATPAKKPPSLTRPSVTMFALNASMVLPLTSPTINPTTPISTSGISLMNVADT